MSERFTITLEATDSSVPMAVRVRRLLKSLWRGYGLRCVEVTAQGAGDISPVAHAEPCATSNALIGKKEGECA